MKTILKLTTILALAGTAPLYSADLKSFNKTSSYKRVSPLTKVALNPQPLPPGERVSLNPQPLPPKVLKKSIKK